MKTDCQEFIYYTDNRQCHTVCLTYINPPLQKNPKNLFFKSGQKKNMCVYVTRPTLIFASDPMYFYTEFG